MAKVKIKPVNGTVVVDIPPKEDKIGNILLPATVNDVQEVVIGTIGFVEVDDEFKVGDTILFPAYAKKEVTLNGVTRQLIKKADILAVIGE